MTTEIDLSPFENDDLEVIGAAYVLMHKAVRSGGTLPDDDRSLPVLARCSFDRWPDLKAQIMPRAFDLDPRTNCWVLKQELAR